MHTAAYAACYGQNCMSKSYVCLVHLFKPKILLEWKHQNFLLNKTATSQICWDSDSERSFGGIPNSNYRFWSWFGCLFQAVFQKSMPSQIADKNQSHTTNSETSCNANLKMKTSCSHGTFSALPKFWLEYKPLSACTESESSSIWLRKRSGTFRNHRNLPELHLETALEPHWNLPEPDLGTALERSGTALKLREFHLDTAPEPSGTGSGTWGKKTEPDLHEGELSGMWPQQPSEADLRAAWELI